MNKAELVDSIKAIDALVALQPEQILYAIGFCDSFGSIDDHIEIYSRKKESEQASNILTELRKADITEGAVLDISSEESTRTNPFIQKLLSIPDSESDGSALIDF